MALIKEKMTKFGMPCSYWKITYISLDNINKYGNVSLGLFYNETSTSYVDYYTELIDTPEKYNNYFSATALSHYKNIYEAGYDFIQTFSDFFKDAELIEDNEDLEFTNPKFVNLEEVDE